MAAARSTLSLALTSAAVAAMVVAAPSAAAASPAQPPDGDALSVVGLTTTGALVKFKADSPRRAFTLGTVRGLAGDGRLVGIDYRVQDGKLYALGNAGGIYTITTSNTRARKVSQLTVPLSGGSFDIDFNPAANRLRVISDTGQNLRHNIDDPAGTPAAGTTVADGTLTYPEAGSTPAFTATGVTGAAYTNNDLDPTTSTTLFDIDTSLDQVVLQSPANSGLVAATGKLGVDAGARVGFDIFTTVRDGTTVANHGLAALTVGGSSKLYSIDLLTGRATWEFTFPASKQVVDLAFPLLENS